MRQSLAIMLLGNPLSQSSHTALLFTQAAIAQGVKIERLFFYHDAVLLASTLHVYPQDTFNLSAQWQQLIQAQQLPATACIASALKRGLVNEEEAQRYQKPQHNFHTAFELAGLGTWLEAINNANQHICFGP